jgi:quercetin dioxygenase-like cupin family protein
MTTVTYPQDVMPSGVKVVHLPLKDQPFVPGRRHNIKYRELGATEATAGKVRAQVMHTHGSQGPNGWHYHVCDIQFLYVLKGHIDLQFYPGTSLRLQAGDAITIPGGVVHQELGSNDDDGGAQTLEISLPAELGTVGASEPKAP